MAIPCLFRSHHPFLDITGQLFYYALMGYFEAAIVFAIGMLVKVFFWDSPLEREDSVREAVVAQTAFMIYLGLVFHS